ncbi:hypothetical protein JB92DRAFT_3087310 [Gautieria morchelliformis]|nr:hypothetical protein JB92DRAFT_3087310 [Gautieria morchelliformis]
MGVSDTEAKNRIIQAAPAGSAIPGWRFMDEFLGKGQLTKQEPFDGVAAHETALLCYSSGTTSKSRGVEATSCLSCVLWSDYHIYGLVNLVFNPIYRGAPQDIMSHFDPDAACANIERYKVTVALVVPPILVVLTHHPAPEKYDLSSLKLLFSAAPLGDSLALAIHARLRKLGADVMFPQGWGLTETSPTCSIGKLLPNMQARLVLDDGEIDAATCEAGEIWVKGPNVMKSSFLSLTLWGYLNIPQATMDVITPDGWFKTGDIAVVDNEGNFKVVDRKKELIKCKGFQVTPAELEEILLAHPKVVDAGVIGVFSEAEATEYLRAYIIPRGLSSREAFRHEIQAWIQAKVARHRYLCSSIPLILRRELRELAKKDLQVSGSVKARL